MSVKQKLIEEFNSEIEEVSKIEVGTEEYKIAVDGVSKLADRIIEINKFEAENSMKVESRDIENNLREQQLKNEKRDQIVKNCVTLGLGIASLIAYGASFLISRRDEREGYIQTSEGGRNSLRNLLKLKF